MRTFVSMFVAGLLIFSAWLANADKKIEFVDTSTVYRQCEYTKQGRSPYYGHYGYVITTPENYMVFPRFEDVQKTNELAVFMPCTIAQNVVGPAVYGQLDEALYGVEGVIRMEVQPRMINGIRYDLAMSKKVITQFLQKRGEVFETKEVSLALPAFEIDVTKPVELKILTIEGQKVMYQFTTGQGNDVIDDMIKSLREVNPHDHPGQ